MKIIKFLLLFFVLSFSQVSHAEKWIKDGQKQETTLNVMDAHCKPDEEQPKYVPDLHPENYCIAKPRAGFSCQEDNNYTCYENCRENFVSSGCCTCHFKNATTQDRHCKTSTKTERYDCKIAGIKTKNGCLRTRTETNCDDCRDEYKSTGLFCEYQGTRDYAKKSYQRDLRKKTVCELQGYTVQSFFTPSDLTRRYKCACDQNISITLKAEPIPGTKNRFNLTATPTNFGKCEGDSIFTAKFSAVGPSPSYQDNVVFGTCTSTSPTTPCSIQWDAIGASGTYKVKAQFSGGSNSVVSNEVTVTKSN